MSKWVRWTIPLALLAMALMSFLAGATMPSLVLLALGLCLEMAFWARLGGSERND